MSSHEAVNQNMDAAQAQARPRGKNKPSYEVVDHYRLADERVIEESRYNGEIVIYEDAPEVLRKLAPGERAFISGDEVLQPFVVVDGLWVNGTWMHGWYNTLNSDEREFNLCTIKHRGETVYKCFEPVDPIEVTSCERVDGKWIVRLGDGGFCSGSTVLYLVIVR
jgi:hypothetical protein